MELGTDVEFLQADDSKASVHFSIKNQAKVKDFLENKDLQAFLTDQFSLDADKSGCRITIEKVDDKTLSISRKITSTTWIHAANGDLLSTLISYIIVIPKDQESQWFDVIGALRYDFTAEVPQRRHLTRGKKYLLL